MYVPVNVDGGLTLSAIKFLIVNVFVDELYVKSASPPKFPALLNCTCSFTPAAVALIVIVSVPEFALIEILLPFSSVNVSSEASAITLPPDGDIAIVLNASLTDPPPPPPEPVYAIVTTSPFLNFKPLVTFVLFPEGSPECFFL